MKTQPGRLTWETRTPISEPEHISTTLRGAGILASSNSNETGEGTSSSEILCIAGVGEKNIHALVACPSGLLYRFEPKFFEHDFWSFAARHYYWITNCLADRAHVAHLTGVPLNQIRGKTLLTGRQKIPYTSLDSILSEFNI